MPFFRRYASLVGLAAILSVSMPQAAAQIEDVRVIQGPGALPMPRDIMPPEPPPTGTGVIEGAVISADLGRPVRRATVRLSSTVSRPPQTVTSDDAGRFRFEGVAAGEFLLIATKPGYLESTFGQRQPGSGRPGTPISVANGQRIERLSLPIARGGVLAGTVADDGGEPAFGTEVRAFKFTWQRGVRNLRLAGSAMSDDRGSFRIGALPPGEYLVMASPAGDVGPIDDVDMFGPMGGPGVAVGRMARPGAPVTTSVGPSSGYAPVFFPGTTSSAGATRITIRVSEERAGLDLQLPLVPMARVTGTITGDGAAPAAGTMVRLIDLEMPVPGFGLRATGTGPDGRFTFEDVPPGRYRVQAQNGQQNRVFVEEGPLGAKVMMQFTSAARADGPGGPGGPFGGIPPVVETRWAVAEFTVTGAGPESLTLMLQPGISVSGRLAFDGTDTPPADLTPFRVALTSADPNEPGLSTAFAGVAEDGRFTISGVAPGAYRVTMLSPSAWRPKSFDVGGRDALDFLLTVDGNQPIDGATLTLTTRAAALSGTLVDASGRPATAYTIVIFPDDPTYWTPGSRRVQATRPSTSGRFLLPNLPAGSYRLVAVDDLEDGQWSDPAVLSQLSGAALPLTLGDGENKTQDMRVAR